MLFGKEQCKISFKRLTYVKSQVFFLHSLDVDNTISQEVRIASPLTCEYFKDNEKSTCLHCSSDEGNTRFQAYGLTW